MIPIIPINIAVFADDRSFAAQVETAIYEQTDFTVAFNTSNYSDMLSYHERTTSASLYLIDIVHLQSGETKGFDLADIIATRDAGNLLVFMTAYKDFIIHEAYYKCLSFNCIMKGDGAIQEVVDTVLLAAQHLNEKCFKFYHEGRLENIYIPYIDIAFVETVKRLHKVILHTRHDTFTIPGTLESICKDLKPPFFRRCHQSYIVNIARIESIDKSNRRIHLDNGETCRYSRLYFNPNISSKLGS